jgi:hypothetical protein
VEHGGAAIVVVVLLSNSLPPPNPTAKIIAPPHSAITVLTLDFIRLSIRDCDILTLIVARRNPYRVRALGPMCAGKRPPVAVGSTRPRHRLRPDVPPSIPYSITPNMRAVPAAMNA